MTEQRLQQIEGHIERASLHCWYVDPKHFEELCAAVREANQKSIEKQLNPTPKASDRLER